MSPGAHPNIVRVPHPNIALFAMLEPALSEAEGVGTLTLTQDSTSLALAR
jgi:hypothetical protein